MPTDFDVDRLLREGSLSQVEHHTSLSSTNDRARAIAPHLPAGETALVIADEQSAGRGRGTNRWWTGQGSLACSLVFDPAARGISRQHFPLISLATAVAIVDAVQSIVPGSRLGLHWPNDVFAAGRKLAGILVEVLPDGMHIVGIGLNINNRPADAPQELRNTATSLCDLSGREHAALGRSTGHLVAVVAQLARLSDRFHDTRTAG